MSCLGCHKGCDNLLEIWAHLSFQWWHPEEPIKVEEGEKGRKLIFLLFTKLLKMRKVFASKWVWLICADFIVYDIVCRRMKSILLRKFSPSQRLPASPEKVRMHHKEESFAFFHANHKFIFCVSQSFTSLEESRVDKLISKHIIYSYSETISLHNHESWWWWWWKLSRCFVSFVWA